MARLPSMEDTRQADRDALADLKRGGGQSRGEFIWQNQGRVYAIALMATGNQDSAAELTIMSFRNAFLALQRVNPKHFKEGLWQWLAGFAVDICAEYHQQRSGPLPERAQMDPGADGSKQLNLETTIIVTPQRAQHCLASLSEIQKKVYVLRHQLELNYNQIATVLNQHPTDVMAWLFRARVQLVKCLGRG